MTGFRGFQDLYGTYQGNYDGRRAQLEIEDIKDDSPYYNFHVRLTDLDRDEVYVVTHQETQMPSHILTNITLNREGGPGTVFLKELLLYTWDITYLSGVSVWNRTDYGMSFQRQ